MEKVILIMFHALFGGTVVLMGGFIGYIFTMKLTGNHEILAFVVFGIAALLSMVAYIKMSRIPKRRAIL